MAGTNRILKAGQLLFKAGDKSDGMYLIRKGELQVFLEQNGHETLLAKIGPGGLIGEMALFDNSVRSASVKAISDCEVTHISSNDFAKLMRQIPKWFVSLMSALSGRLRATNERLQKLENSQNGGSLGANIHTLTRQLNLLLLVWAKDGTKDGKDQVVAKKLVEQILIETFAEDVERVSKIFEILSEHKIIGMRYDQHKQLVLFANNRSLLQQSPRFLQQFHKAHRDIACLPDSALQLLRLLEQMMNAAPYESLTIPLRDLEKEGAIAGLATETWASDLGFFKNAWDEVKTVKASSGLGLKTTKKDISHFVRLNELLASFHKAQLI